ncbi:MAG: 1-acyl-sn-glycerol-3-phosphate acyltransferase [Alphaproteobacteria bacterium]|nr:1-acyl-sn-glycerol-3-phosphate acyltransferase [Alphaproteobacteria bacterium]
MAIFAWPLLLFSKSIVFYIAYLWSRSILKGLELIVGIHYQIVGHDHLVNTKAIYAVKHQSTWETLFFILLLPRPVFILKKELIKIPVFGDYLRAYGMIPIDRSGKGISLKYMLTATKKIIDDNRSVIIFPEGTRVKPGKKAPYHIGIAALYKYIDASIIPVALNSGLFWGRNAFVKKPGTITIKFLEPLAQGLTREEFMKNLEEKIEQESYKLL